MLKAMFILTLAIASTSAGYSLNFNNERPPPAPQAFAPMAPQVQEPQIKVEHVSRPRPVVSHHQQSYAAQVQSMSPQVQSMSPQVQTYHVQEIRKPMIPIVSFSSSSDDAGNYHFKHVGGDGTVSMEQGHQVRDGAVKGGVVQWTSPEGINFQLSYKADEEGFRAQGSHLPTPPPLTKEVQDAIALIEAKTAEHVALVNAAAAANAQLPNEPQQQYAASFANHPTGFSNSGY